MSWTLSTDISYMELDMQHLMCGAEPMDITVLKQGNSSLSAFVKGIFIGMKKDFSSVRRYNISFVVL